MAELAGLDADDGVELRVELCVATEHLGSDGVGLDPLRPAGEGVLDDIGPKAPIALADVETWRLEDALQLRANALR